MMKGQARRSGLVMGFDTHMIAGRRACSRPARPTQPNITNRSNPHYDETLGIELLELKPVRCIRRLTHNVNAGTAVEMDQKLEDICPSRTVIDQDSKRPLTGPRFKG
jgi:hypothetical protein